MSEQPTDPKQTHRPVVPQGGLGGLGGASDPPLGANLEPVLRRVCGGRLSSIRWFRTDWQRGGALTGYADWDDPPDTQQAVVVKMPVGPGELQWLIALQDAGGLVPHLYAHGDTLGGYDIAWVVMECLPYGPLSPAWGGAEFDLLIDAVARFYAAADCRYAREPAEEDWEQILSRSRECTQDPGFLDCQRWKTALKKSHRKLGQWIKIWNDRPTDQVCHGDLHPGNAMTRLPAPQGPAVLFDFALTRRGHWVEDAVYLEHLYWAKRSQLGGRKLCNLISRARKAQGLPVTSHWPRIATVRRAMLALSAPLQFRKESDDSHLRAALEVLETHVS